MIEEEYDLQIWNEMKLNKKQIELFLNKSFMFVVAKIKTTRKNYRHSGHKDYQENYEEKITW